MKIPSYMTTSFQVALTALVLMSGGVVSAQTTPPTSTIKQAENSAINVYPVPQEIKKTGGKAVAAGLTIQSLNADKDALAVLKSAFTHVPQGGLSVKIGEKANMEKSPALKSLCSDIPNVVGAYKLVVSPQEIIIIGNDDAGTFYGVQTLTQLGKKTDKGVEFPAVVIKDWPDVPFRGTVEGFYGRPWGYEDRISQFKFYGKYKLNTYIYGPKDDPFHGFSTRWREPYPDKQGEQIKELVKIAKHNKVNFVWAVHPGRDIKWGEADEQAAIKKFQMMYDLGVRSFAVFFDDIGGEQGKAEGQIKFLNLVNREFIHKKTDVTPLIMCPTQYNKAWSGGDYLPSMGEELDKDIRIMWTGNSVVHDINKPDLEWINERIKRPAFIWWNFPVSDYVRSMVLLGRIYGLEKGTKDDMSGFTSNPMDKPEASKVALFSIADFTWNQEAFNSEKSWKDGIKRLFPACADAMQTMANHNSDPGPSAHGYRREESVEIAPYLTKLVNDYKTAGKLTNSSNLTKVKAEFQKIAQAPAAIRKNANNPALLRELEPWLVSFEALGKAGLYSLALAEKVQTGNTNDALDSALTALTEFNVLKDSSENYSKKINAENKDKWQTSIKTGSLVLRPAVEEIMDIASAQMYAQISGKPINIRRPYISSSFRDGVDKMLDDDQTSFFYCREIQKVGDYFGVDLGGVQEIKTVNVLTGRKDGDHDAVNKGQLEISQDGKRWENLMPESTGLHVTYEGSGKKARFVRYRITHAGVPGGKSDVWTAIRDFKVNARPGNTLATSVEQLKNVVVNSNDKAVYISPVLEVINIQPKQYFGVTLAATPVIDQLELDLKTNDLEWAKVEITTDGKNWKPLSLEIKDQKFKAKVNDRVKGIRVSNSSKDPVEIKLTEFRALYPAGGGGMQDKATDGKLVTRYDMKLENTPAPIPLKETNPGAAYIIAKGSAANVYAQDATGDWKKVGQIKASEKPTLTAINLKSVKKPVTAMGFSAAGSGEAELSVHEIICR